MPRVRCHYLDCIFLDDKYCTAAAIEINPDTGCTTYTPNEDADATNWDDDVELDDWDSMGTDEDSEDLWADDEDDEDLDDDVDEY